MEKPVNNSSKNFFEKSALKITQRVSSTAAFMAALIFVLCWFIAGLVIGFSQNWLLVINTSTTIITFLMVFLIQKTQNKGALAVQLNLNELVAAHKFASNRLVDVENMTEDELRVIQKYYSKLKEFIEQEDSLQQPHSIDELHEQHELKKEMENELRGKLKK